MSCVVFVVKLCVFLVLFALNCLLSMCIKWFKHFFVLII